MKKVLCLLLSVIVCCSFVSCSGDKHDGQAKTPSGSSVLSGRDYEDVVKIFEDKGFTNIKTEPIDDLVLGWITKDGEVEEVLVGGDVDYSADEWVPAGTEVIIRYHTFCEVEEEDKEEVIKETSSSDKAEEIVEVLTVNNCVALKKLLAIKDPSDPIVKDFANKYEGKIIEFDGNIAYMNNHENYSTRYDILIYAGDYSEDSSRGPNFKFVDVNMFDLNLVGDNIPDYIGIGNNVHIIAEVGEYNEYSELFELLPVSTSVR